MRGHYFRFFFNSTAKTLVIDREFFGIFLGFFPTLFSQLISIFMSLLHTFSKGVKIDARLPKSERFASIMRSGVLLCPPVSAGTQNVTTPVFVMVLIRLRVPQEAERTQLRIMEVNRSLPGSRASVFTPIENVWRRLMNNNANELGKQGGKNPRKIPKFSINHEFFSCIIEKYLK